MGVVTMQINSVLKARWGWLLPACGLLFWSSVTFADIEASRAYLRMPPPGSPVAAAFMHLRNSGAQVRQLVGARSELARKIEVHTHEHVDGMMRMRPVAQLQVPAYSEVVLKPGGYHLMVFGLREGLAAGAVFPVTLVFADGSEVTVEAEVRRV